MLYNFSLFYHRTNTKYFFKEIGTIPQHSFFQSNIFIGIYGNNKIMLLQTYLCARTVFERRFDVGAIFCKFIATYSFLVTFLMFNRVAKLGKLLKPILDYFIWIVAW